MSSLQNLFSKNKRFISIPIVLLAILAMVILPLPSWILDVFFTLNIVLAIVVLLSSVSVKKSLDFSAFPSILLIATLLRLTLNIASTRVVLLHGSEGGDAAGQVIKAFGEVVIGGNYIVGMIVFIILMIINFMVVTKGGERISEVSARFTLDALPGKQMAIDADVNSGALTVEQSKEKRKEVAREAGFFGAMDGASKFVKGDAIAGLLVLIINLIGGICIGIFAHKMDASTAFKTYSLLTIGDGLVAQIPSFLLSTAAAIIVTRGSDTSEITDVIHKQLLSKPKVIISTSAIMIIMGLVPGMPTVAFLAFAAVLGFAAWKQKGYESVPHEESQEKVEQIVSEQTPMDWQSIPFIKPLEIKLGYRLLDLVNPDKGAELQKRIAGIRKTISEEYGFLLSDITVRDDLTIPSNCYSISLNGFQVNQDELEPEKLLAIQLDNTYSEIEGILCKEPAYGMDGVWISYENKDKAQNLGYSVVDNSSVIATHLTKIIKENLPELLQHDDIVSITERLDQIAPQLNEALNAVLTPIQMLNVFRILLKENVSVLDIKAIATELLNASESTKDPILLASDVRCALGKHIVSSIVGNTKVIQVATLASELEKILLDAFQSAQQTRFSMDSFPVDPSLVTKFQENMPKLINEININGFAPILLVAPQLRPLLAKYAYTFTVGLNVLSFNEMPNFYDVQSAVQLG